MFTHADVCNAILRQEGNYLLYAKDNQERLQGAIAAVFIAAETGGFSPKDQAAWQAEVQTATQRGKGHGRIECRSIATTTWRNAYLTDGPQVGQVFRLVRQRSAGGKTTEEVVYGITSLSRADGDATRLLELSRAHGGIENGLHHTRDETFREDRCRVRRGQAARVLASLRNVAVSLLRPEDHPSVAAATRAMAAFPEQALALLKAPASISE